MGLPWSAIAAYAHECPAHDEMRTEALFGILVCTIIHRDHVHRVRNLLQSVEWSHLCMISLARPLLELDRLVTQIVEL